jgi:putative ABC transport system substrate-binding protein
MRRREFIAGLGTAAAFPLAAQAQQPRLPVIGHLGPTTKDASSEVSAAVGRGLAATGFIEGQNLAIEHRWAIQGHAHDRLDSGFGRRGPPRND